MPYNHSVDSVFQIEDLALSAYFSLFAQTMALWQWHRNEPIAKDQVTMTGEGGSIYRQSQVGG